MKITFPLRRPIPRQTLTFLYMVLLVLVTFVLATVSALAAHDCILVVPYKQLHALHVGAPLPETVEGRRVGRDDKLGGDAGWFLSGPYRFREAKNGQLDYLQYTLEEKQSCIRIGHTRLTTHTSLRDLQEKFPGCRFYQGIPVDQFLCEGFTLFVSPGTQKTINRVDVSTG